MRPYLVRTMLVIVILLTVTIGHAQQSSFGQMAQAAYDKHSYGEGAPLFLLAAVADPNNAFVHLYNAACCYALSGQKDLAFYSLGGAIVKGWRDKSHTEQDSDLESLHADPRWKEMIEKFPAVSGVDENRDAIINDLNNLAALAYQYRIRPHTMGGGEGSYLGFKIPPRMTTNGNASYETLIVDQNVVRYKGTSAKGFGSVAASIDQDGRLSGWVYDGKFVTVSATISSNRDALINQINNIAAYCYQYRIRPSSMGGGQGAYTGVALPEKLASTDDGTFAFKEVDAQKVKIEAVSKKFKGSITTILDENGRLGTWTYFGDLQ